MSSIGLFYFCPWSCLAVLLIIHARSVICSMYSYIPSSFTGRTFRRLTVEQYTSKSNYVIILSHYALAIALVLALRSLAIVLALAPSFPRKGTRRMSRFTYDILHELHFSCTE